MEIEEVTRESIERCNKVLEAFNQHCKSIGTNCITFDQYLKLMDMDKVDLIEQQIRSLDDSVNEITFQIKKKAGEYDDM